MNHMSRECTNDSHNKPSVYCSDYWYCDLRIINPFPALVISEMTRICETVPTPPRAAADRPRALGYMVWMRTIDT